MDGSPEDQRSARRAEAAERRRRRRRGDLALGAVVVVAVVSGALWATNRDAGLGLGWSREPVARATIAGAAPAHDVPVAAEPVADDHARDRGLTPSGRPAKAKVTVPVLMYHRVAPASTATNDVSYDLTVTPGAFREQMRWLKAHGYEAISEARLFRAIEDGAALPARPVVITFDDGYVDATTNVLPVLESLGWPATFFIITSRIGERAFLDWTQLRHLSDAGMDIGSHTVDHVELPSQDPASRAAALSRSRKTLEKGLGHPVRWFCYPAGRFDDASAKAVGDAGYLLAYTTQGGSVLRSDSLTLLPRVRVSGRGSISSFAAAMRSASAAT